MRTRVVSGSDAVCFCNLIHSPPERDIMATEQANAVCQKPPKPVCRTQDHPSERSSNR